MKTTVDIDKDKLLEFSNKKVMTKKELSSLFNCSGRTVQRKLKQWKAVRSYNHNGQYYALLSIIDTYIDDFAKYAKVTKHIYLRKVFNAVPGVVGQKFVYAQVDRSIKSRELKEALELLESAGIVTRVRQTSGSGIPFAASVHESIFKVLFLDVGLFHAISGIYSETIKEKSFTAIFKGAVAEQFAVQELIAYQSPYTNLCG